MRIIRALATLGLAACGSSTSPRHNPLTDSISVNGQWVGADTQRDTMTLILAQKGDSVTGTGDIDDIAIRVTGRNFTPQHCGPALCSLDARLEITDLAGDTLTIGGHFVTDTNHLAVFNVDQQGPAPGLPFVDSAFTLVRQTVTEAHEITGTGHEIPTAW